MAQGLLQQDPARLGSVDGAGQGALHHVCRVLASGASCDVPVYLAVWLLGAGADPSLRDRHGCVPLHYAALSGNVHVVQCLVWHMLRPLAFDGPFGAAGPVGAKAAAAAVGAGVGAGVNAFGSLLGLSEDMDLGAAAAQGPSPAVTPLFFAAHHRRADAVACLLGGVPRPHAAHPMSRVQVPQAGGICDASGSPVPYPGSYWAATDGSNFGLNEDAHDAAVAAQASAAAGGDPDDLAWRSRATITLRHLEEVCLCLPVPPRALLVAWNVLVPELRWCVEDGRCLLLPATYLLELTSRWGVSMTLPRSHRLK